MAILKNTKNDELIISCKCGCDEGIHLKIYQDEDEYSFMTFTNGNFYKEQGSAFINKAKKIWAIIRNKDFYYSDICLSKREFNEFKKWINNK